MRRVVSASQAITLCVALLTLGLITSTTRSPSCTSSSSSSSDFVRVPQPHYAGCRSIQHREAQRQHAGGGERQERSRPLPGWLQP